MGTEPMGDRIIGQNHGEAKSYWTKTWGEELGRRADGTSLVESV